jgi:1-deoxy-D-xylulose-5-phosphate reductoisomerase
LEAEKNVEDLVNKKNVVILGSTGSIGRQTLEVIDQHPESFNLLAIAAYDEIDTLVQQIERYQPEYAVVGNSELYSKLKNKIEADCLIMAGMEGLCETASLPKADIVVIAVSGAVGIKPTLSAIQAQKVVALANKETLVAAGSLVMGEVKKNGVDLIPVDSEHSAVFQCIRGEKQNLKKIWLTASGGPFRDFTAEQLENVTVEMALQHPNWVMGPKITIDSATMMNKGLEVIEAHHLFETDYDKIDIIIQRESIIHSMVELVDGAFIAHFGVSDMRIPIQFALTFPNRTFSPAPALDFEVVKAIHFDKPDTARFPALDLAYQAGKIGGTMPAVLNAANEVAVNSFLNREINFTSISKLVNKVMDLHQATKRPDLDEILGADDWARGCSP